MAPFAAYGSYTCGSVGTTPAELSRQAVLRLQNGEQQLTYRENIEGSWGGDNKLAIPAKFALAIAPFAGTPKYLVTARLRYRALVEPLTEVLLVQRDLQVARASLVVALTRQALDRALLERETGLEEEGPRAAAALADRPALEATLG
jgi:hypothetical protein